MILGFVSDAHGNEVGLDRCLAVLRQLRADRIYFLGDSVGYMPNEEAVLTHLEDSGAICIRGNHEEMLLGNVPIEAARNVQYRLSEARARISQARIAWMEQWPMRREVAVDGARLLLVHGNPLDPITGYVYPDTDLTVFRDLPYDFVLFGQTHRPCIRTIESMTFVNVGSCGMPRDVGNLASCAVLDTRTRSVEILRVKFDAQELISELGSQVHDAVVACLKRTSPTPAFGRLVDV